LVAGEPAAFVGQLGVEHNRDRGEPVRKAADLQAGTGEVDVVAQGAERLDRLLGEDRVAVQHDQGRAEGGPIGLCCHWATPSLRGWGSGRPSTSLSLRTTGSFTPRRNLSRKRWSPSLSLLAPLRQAISTPRNPETLGGPPPLPSDGVAPKWPRRLRLRRS